MAYGHAPYSEAAVRGQARVSLMQRLGQIFSGAGYGLAATPQNAGGLESLATGFAGGFGHANAARQAAEAYAMKKIEAERAQEERQARLGLIEAQTAKASRPEPAPKQEKQFGPRPWYEDPALANDPGAIAARKKATHISPGKGAAIPKPPKPREAVAKRLDIINSADPLDPIDYERLTNITRNPPTPEEGQAAQAKLSIRPGFSRYTRQPTQQERDALRLRR